MCLRLEILLEHKKKIQFIKFPLGKPCEAVRIFMSCYFFSALGQDKLLLQE